MGFFTEHCPECQEEVSKDADYCSHCGCPGASKWSNCSDCGTAVGAESGFCWKCGAKQDEASKRKFYGERWNRSPLDFAYRVLLQTPEKALENGLLVEEGTLAVISQHGHHAATLNPGHYDLAKLVKDKDNSLQKGQQLEAYLIDAKSAETDFHFQSLQDSNGYPVDLSVRLMFQVVSPSLFLKHFFEDGSEFTVTDLGNRLQSLVHPAIVEWLKETSVDEVLLDWKQRESMEALMLKRLDGDLRNLGIALTGIRMGRFGGAAVEAMQEKNAEIGRLVQDMEVNRRLADLSREDKAGAFRDEQKLQDAYDQVTHEYGLKGIERDEEKKKFMQLSEHEVQKAGLAQDYELRRAEILNRLDEQKLVHQRDIADVKHDLEKRKLEFAEEIREMDERANKSFDHQRKQAEVNHDVAVQGIKSLKELKMAKLEAKAAELELSRAHEAARLENLSGASLQGLLATLEGPQADRLLKMAELEMRKGMSAENALAFAAEKSPELATTVAKVLKMQQDESGPDPEN